MQLEHDVWPAIEYVPPGHRSQLICPEWTLYVPAPHGVHCAVPLSKYDPALHGVHVVPPLPTVPRHVTHCTAPAVALYIPTGQLLHIICPVEP